MENTQRGLCVQVRIEREQLKSELMELQKRMEALIDETQRKMVHERDSIRREMETERNQLNDKVGSVIDLGLYRRLSMTPPFNTMLK